MVARVDHVDRRIAVLKQVLRFEVREDQEVLHLRLAVSHQPLDGGQELLHPQCAAGGLGHDQDGRVAALIPMPALAEPVREEEQRAGAQVRQPRRTGVQFAPRVLEASTQFRPGQEHKRLSLAEPSPPLNLQAEPGRAAQLRGG